MEELNQTIQSIRNHVSAAWDKIEEKGGEIPPNKNVLNLGPAIRSISTKPPYDPNNPTLEGLKAAMQAGDYTAFPAGTEIPDTWNGNSNPLIVAQYLSGTSSRYLDESGNNADGVILIRKYCTTPYTAWNTSGPDEYATSTIKQYLDSSYLENCSEELKSLISTIQVEWAPGRAPAIMVPGKWFLMSRTEVYAQTLSEDTLEGFAFTYWKQKTGLTSPSNGPNNGRIIRAAGGSAQAIWLRTYNYSSVSAFYITSNGTVTYDGLAQTKLIYPACFISKN